MFAYCGNNPIGLIDPSGKACIIIDIQRRGNAYTDTGTGNHRSILYNVPLYSQGSYKLCWAFCEVMEFAYRKNLDLDNDQATIVAIYIAMRYHKSMKKSEWNNGGWPSNLGKPVEDIEAVDNLYNALIENGGPLYAAYDSSYEGKPGHLVLVVGVNCSTNEVYTNNPWIRVRGEQSFEEFLMGPAKHKFTVPGYASVRIYLTE